MFDNGVDENSGVEKPDQKDKNDKHVVVSRVGVPAILPHVKPGNIGNDDEKVHAVEK